jgi:predicted dehydrogenase
MNDRFEIRAVCDGVHHRAELVAEELGISATGGYSSLVKRPDIDAVIITSSSWAGPLPILAACDAQKAIYCSHDIDLLPEEVQKIHKKVEKAGIAFSAELLRRNAPATLRLKELIATQLGKPQLLFCHHRLGADRNIHGSTIDPIRRELVELLDWCCFIADQTPNFVTGIVHKRHEETYPEEPIEDYHSLSLAFPQEGSSAPVAQVSCGRYIPTAWQEAVSYRPLASLQVSCERGVAFVDLPSSLVWFDEAGRHQESLDCELPIGERLFDQFYRSITSLVRNRSDLEAIARAHEIIARAEQSHEEGRRMEIFT